MSYFPLVLLLSGVERERLIAVRSKPPEDKEDDLRKINSSSKLHPKICDDEQAPQRCSSFVHLLLTRNGQKQKLF